MVLSKLARPRFFTGYKSKKRSKNARLARGHYKFSTLDLDRKTESMSKKELLELAVDFWKHMREYVYSKRLPTPIIKMWKALPSPRVFGDTQFPVCREYYSGKINGLPKPAHLVRPRLKPLADLRSDERLIIVRLSLRMCDTVRLFIGTLFHEACHVAAMCLNAEHDQTHCKGAHFFAHVDKLHEYFGVSNEDEPTFIAYERPNVPAAVAAVVQVLPNANAAHLDANANAPAVNAKNPKRRRVVQ